MSDELKPCPFCGNEPAPYWKGVGCATSGCLLNGLHLDADKWNRRAQPAEAEGVDFGFDDRSVKVSQEAYSIFLEREQHHLAALSAVTAERDAERRRADVAVADANDAERERDQLRAEVEGLRKDTERYQWLRSVGGRSYSDTKTGEKATGEIYDSCVDAAMAAKEA